MIFKGNAAGYAEGGEIKQAFVGVNGKAKKAYLAFVGDETGKARLLYNESNIQEGNCYSVSSLEEFRELAQTDPHGCFVLERKSYAFDDTWVPIENFYGTLDGGYSAISVGRKNLITNNYGLIKNVNFSFSTEYSDRSPVVNNYGRVTHCYFIMKFQNGCAGVFRNKEGGIVDNCMAALLKVYAKNRTSDTNCALISFLEKGSVLYSCFSTIDCMDTEKTKRFAFAQYLYTGAENDPELKENVRYNYAKISAWVRYYEVPYDFQIKSGLCKAGWWISDFNEGIGYHIGNVFSFQRNLEGIDKTQFNKNMNGLSGDWVR